jgi:tetraacyldisaccharide 4'-kinase
VAEAAAPPAWPGWLAPLAPLTPLYRGAVALRGALYDAGLLRAHRAPVPVISVGNITAGGSGKSPMVAWVAHVLARSGHRPAVVSRGYRGAHRGRATVVSDGSGPRVDAAVAGDEPVMLAAALAGVPVIVSRRRADGAAVAVERFGAKCLILDDGFQHRALARDLDLVMVDGMDPFGSGQLLPAGPLREPIAALRRASAVVVHGGGDTTAAGQDALRRIEGAAARHCPRAPIFHARSSSLCLVSAATGRTAPTASLAGRPVACFAGIARPGRFFEEARRLGADVRWTRSFGDHHLPTDAEIDDVRAAARAAGASLLLTTEKDLARLGPDRAARLEGLHALRIALEVREADTLERLLVGVLS